MVSVRPAGRVKSAGRCATGLLLCSVLFTEARATESASLLLPASTPVGSIPGTTTPQMPAGILPGEFASRRALYITSLTRWAEHAGVPPALAEAVAFVESAFHPRAIGSAGELGLMQVLPATAAMLGFRGTLDDLMEPGTNLRYGVHYLAGAWRLSNGNVCWALTKYRSGHGEQRMTQRSVDYCRRAMLYLAGIGSALASGTAAPITGPPSPLLTGLAVHPPASRRPEQPQTPLRRKAAEDSRRFQEERNARIRLVRSELLAMAGRAGPGLLARWPGLRPPP